MKLTKEEYKVIRDHLTSDMAFMGEGTYNMFSKNDSDDFDEKDAEITKKALLKIFQYFTER